MSIRVYISGPISNMPGNNVTAFAQAFIDLGKRGHFPVSPLHNGLPSAAPWLDHMKADIAMLLTCDAVCLLPGWEKSKGANIERDLAYGLGMDVRTLREWLV